MKTQARANPGWIVGLGVLIAGVSVGLPGCRSESESGTAAPAETSGGVPAPPAAPAAAAAVEADERPRPPKRPLPPDLTPLPDVDYTNLPVALGLTIGSVRQQAASSPGDVLKAAELAALYYVHGFPEASATCFRRAAQLDSSTPLWDYCRGLALEKASQGAEAIASYQVVLERDPNFQLAHARLARLYEAQGQSDAAQRHVDRLDAPAQSIVEADVIERGVRRNGRDPRVLLEDAIAAAQRGDFLRAENYVADALRSDSEAPAAIATRALVRAMQGKTGEAEKDLREVLAQHPDDQFARQALARVLAVAGNAEESEALFRTVLETDPTHVDALNGLAVLLARLDRATEIEPLIAAALEAGRDDALLHYQMGETYASLGRIAEAKAALRTALELQPSLGPAHFRLGQLHAQQGDLLAARAAWERAVTAQPTLSAARLALIGVLLPEGQYERAIELAGEGVGLAPDSIEMLNVQAWLLATAPRESLRDPQRAVTAAERAAELSAHGEFETLDTLAAAYASAGRFVEARRTIAQAIEVAQLRRAQLADRNAMEQVPRITALIDKYKERQALYEADKPYYE